MSADVESIIVIMHTSKNKIAQPLDRAMLLGYNPHRQTTPPVWPRRGCVHSAQRLL